MLLGLNLTDATSLFNDVRVAVQAVAALSVHCDVLYVLLGVV